MVMNAHLPGHRACAQNLKAQQVVASLCKLKGDDTSVRPQTVYIGKYGKIRCFYICLLLRTFSILLVNLGGLGVFPLDPPRNSTRFAAANASSALTAVRFRLATVSLQLFGISGACLYMLAGIS